jgi:hypothetical protein
MISFQRLSFPTLWLLFQRPYKGRWNVGTASLEGVGRALEGRWKGVGRLTLDNAKPA